MNARRLGISVGACREPTPGEDQAYCDLAASKFCTDSATGLGADEGPLSPDSLDGRLFCSLCIETATAVATTATAIVGSGGWNRCESSESESEYDQSSEFC